MRLSKNFLKKQFRGKVLELMEWYFCQRCYWITPAPKRSAFGKPCQARTHSHLEVRIAYVSGWYAFLFPFDVEANAILQTVPKSDRYFFCEPVNAYRAFKGWLVSQRYFSWVTEQLNLLNAWVRYVVPEDDFLPKIPPALAGMSYQIRFS